MEGDPLSLSARAKGDKSLDAPSFKLDFVEPVFGGNPFAHWLLSPVILLFAIFIPLCVKHWTPVGIMLMVDIDLGCMALLASFWLPSRFAHWAFRTFAALIFIGCAIIFVDDLFVSDKPASPRNALLIFIVFGLPFLVYALLGRLPLPALRLRDRPDRVTFTEDAVTRTMPNGVKETIRWDNLDQVVILTTDEGPWFEDVFFLLVGRDDKSGCAVPQEAQGFDELLRRLQQLPGFDNKAVIDAMGSTSNAKFVCWKRPEPTAAT